MFKQAEIQNRAMLTIRNHQEGEYDVRTLTTVNGVGLV